MNIQNNEVPRPEHPRPDFMRDTYLNLNGEWQFAFDDANAGLDEQWYLPEHELDRRITVPFCYQCERSGIGPTDAIHPVLWYRRNFTLPEDMRGKPLRLCFGAVDYRAAVYVNGKLVGSHEGGYTPFSFDISRYIQPDENDLCLRVEDYPDCTQPRGKQYWREGLMGCWYTPVSGVWQTVYLENTGDAPLRYVHVTPDVDRLQCAVSLELPVAEPLECELEFTYNGEPWKRVTVPFATRTAIIPVDMTRHGGLDPVPLWSPDQPALFELSVRLLREGREVDHVRTYFGMRKIEVVDGVVYLNNCPLYQRLVLDQGYWPDTLLTPPSDEALQTDLRMTKALGYNGARKHQKVEDPRYYYWADHMGVLVWGEVPSPYDACDASVRGVAQTLAEFIERDYNHPCIITWVPINESWGFQQIRTSSKQQAAARMLYQLCKTYDGTRLCSVNDGWEQVETDICALHDYADTPEVLALHFASREQLERHAADWRACYARGVMPTGKEALMLTEYGGIAMDSVGLRGKLSGMETWGYHDKVSGEEAFFERFGKLHEAVRNIPECQGYCYTQLTDVLQEINGLLTPQRAPKVDVERFAKMNLNAHGRTNQVLS